MRPGCARLAFRRRRGRIAARDQPLDFGVGDSMMPARGRRRANGAAVDPLFQRRVADAETLRRGANSQECHGVSATMRQEYVLTISHT